jgi:DNA-binding CsgD family transcriptional regulator
VSIISAAEILRITDLLYAAAVEDHTSGSAELAWDTVLDLLSDTCCARGGTVVVEINQARFDFVRTQQAIASLKQGEKYITYCGQPDPVLTPVLARTACGTLVLSEEQGNEDVFMHTLFYNDWMRPRGEYVGAAAKLVDDGKSCAVLYLSRDRSAGSFTADEIHAISVLLPHLQRATALAIRFRERHTASFAGGVTAEGTPLMIVDRHAVPVYANAAAERLLHAGDRISVEKTRSGASGGLTLPSSSDARRLRNLIAATCAVDQAATVRKATVAPITGTGSCVAVQRRDASATLVIRVTPMPIAAQSDRSLFRPRPPKAMETLAIVTCVELQTTAARARLDGPVPATLCEAFGLTVAEAEVAIEIATGSGLAAVAAHRQVSLATVRTQAAQAYQKTGVRGQVQLAAFIACLASQLVRVM